MLSLCNPLHETYEYRGVEYPIDLTFDNVLRFYQLLDDKEFNNEEIVAMAFEMFFDMKTKDPEFVLAAFRDISDYISHEPYGNDGGDETVSSPIKYYSFTQDAGAIYASFMEQYGMDLIEQEGKLHWDKFKALFAGLGPKTYFQRIVQIRMRDTSKLEGQELTDVIQAQSYYELDENKTEASRQAQMDRVFAMLKANAE